ncbi:uncharacterized protein BEWA_019630 [Theileria equi strain WA]|uniref:Membrane protein, putative n=1 Tax=Theileria equi strain WA TaxID=1537102 RepID=L0ATZ5_THEEQ|nr:uncharacterized protein BEWA_019630 [Theileria equi strain WA]AFZ79117.1 membrane protein, putative [Theileria equi strain WA]|eukprot:XP_004828783.1 uncharacterized protein BEWA_019630 [Theileria equi strain WA]
MVITGWIILWSIIFEVTECDVTDNKDIPLGLIRECLGIRGESLKICNNIKIEEGISDPNTKCSIDQCRKSCCIATNECNRSKSLSNAFFNCISDKVIQEHGSCCILTDKKYKYARTVYLSGAFGLFMVGAGIYVLSSMKSGNDSANDEEPSYDYGDDDMVEFEYDAPHLKVKKIIATDGDDVFWEN